MARPRSAAENQPSTSRPPVGVDGRPAHARAEEQQADADGAGELGRREEAGAGDGEPGRDDQPLTVPVGGGPPGHQRDDEPEQGCGHERARAGQRQPELVTQVRDQVRKPVQEHATGRLRGHAQDQHPPPAAIACHSPDDSHISR
jgi:hypothetical protein